MNFLEMFGAWSLLTIAIVLTLVVYIILSNTENEADSSSEAAAGGSLFIMLVGAIILHKINPEWKIPSLIFSLTFLIYVAGYLCIGAIYSIYGWRRHCIKYLERQKKYFDKWQSYRSRDEGEQLQYIRELEAHYPVPSKWKDLLASFILFWPICLAKVLSKDLVWNILGRISDSLDVIYSKVSASTLNKAIDDLKAQQRQSEVND